MESSEVGDLDRDPFQAHTLIINQTLSLVGAMSLKYTVELDIADIINNHGNLTSLIELARLILIPREKDDMLRRLMRLLMVRAPFSKLLLCKGAIMSAYVSALQDQALVQQPMLCCSAWFRSEGGLSPLELAHGRQIWELMGERSELMSSNTMVVLMMVVVEHPKISRGLTSLVDVGGGTGAAARAIATAFPKVNCTMLDLPHVVGSNTSSAVNAVRGDMFIHIPPANAVFLKADEDYVKILNRYKEAISPREEGGKVIIVDKVVSSRPRDQVVTETQLLYDVLMMGIHSVIEIYSRR